jgi:hypothetical protein
MKLFLNHFMKTHRRAAEVRPGDSDPKQKAIAAKQKEFAVRMDGFAKLFAQTAEAVVKYLGPKPFHVRKGLNAAVFDSVFTAFALHLDKVGKEKPTATEIRQVKSQFDELLKDEVYKPLTTSATTDKDVVPKRLNRAEKLLFH